MGVWKFKIISIILPGDSDPKNVCHWKRIIIIPIPPIKPDKTGYDMYLTYWATLTKPNKIWNTPANANDIIIKGSAFVGSSEKPASAIIVAATIVIGPVGSLISVFVPAINEAVIARIIAVYNPASGPKPLCNPKASPIGRAIIAAVSPPVKSPFMFEVKFFKPMWIIYI